jgi:hypothetical protein
MWPIMMESLKYKSWRLHDYDLALSHDVRTAKTLVAKGLIGRREACRSRDAKTTIVQ